MNNGFEGITVLATDMIDTLIERQDDVFVERAAHYLFSRGVRISSADFRKFYRERYLEYSMGNYSDDMEYYNALFACFATSVSAHEHEEWMATLTDLRQASMIPFDEAAVFLKQISTRYRIVLATNYVAEWANYLLEVHGWNHYFHSTLVSSSCRYRKPAKQYFQELIRICGVSDPKEILLIGDSIANDVYGATNSGLRAVLLDRDDKMQHHSTEVVETVVGSLKALVDLLVTSS